MGHTGRRIIETAAMNICPTWLQEAGRWLNCTFREVTLCEISTDKTWNWKMWDYFLLQDMGALRTSESPFQITLPCHIQDWEQSDALLLKCLLLSRGWKYLWCESVVWILFSLSVFLGAVFLHFGTMKVHNRNVQLTVKHSHQFRDHFQIWWMSSKYSIHSNHQAEKQSNSWGEKSR